MIKCFLSSSIYVSKNPFLGFSLVSRFLRSQTKKNACLVHQHRPASSTTCTRLFGEQTASSSACTRLVGVDPLFIHVHSPNRRTPLFIHVHSTRRGWALFSSTFTHMVGARPPSHPHAHASSRVDLLFIRMHTPGRGTLFISMHTSGWG